MRALVFWVVVGSATGCSSPSDEQRLREILVAMETAAESGAAGEFMAYVAEDFVGSSGGMGRADLQRMMLAQLRRNTRVHAVITNVEIKLFENRATLNCTALLTGGARGWLPERGEVFSIESGWRRTKDDWELIQASWEK